MPNEATTIIVMNGNPNVTNGCLRRVLLMAEVARDCRYGFDWTEGDLEWCTVLQPLIISQVGISLRYYNRDAVYLRTMQIKLFYYLSPQPYSI